MTTNETCEPCGSRESAPTPYRDVFGLGASLVRCLGCGVKRYDRRVMDHAEANDRAPSHRLSENTVRFGAMDNLDPARRGQFQAAHWSAYTGLVDRLLTWLGPVGVLYEVGAGVGEFLAIARSHGHVSNVSGCDANRRSCELALEYHGVPLEHATFQRALTVPYGADVVVMLDVIEHTETPGADLERARELLRPGGMLLLKTFYDEWHEGRELDLGPEGWTKPHGYFDPIGHLHHFDLPVLRRLVDQTRLQIVEEQFDELYGQVTLYARKPL